MGKSNLEKRWENPEYEVIIWIGAVGGVSQYSCLEYKGRTTWKTKRIAEKHAREYKATHLRDAWVSEC